MARRLRIALVHGGPAHLGAVVAALGVMLLSGCAASPNSSSFAPGRRLPEPDAAFLKKVEKDPFPKAHQTGSAKP